MPSGLMSTTRVRLLRALDGPYLTAHDLSLALRIDHAQIQRQLERAIERGLIEQRNKGKTYGLTVSGKSALMRHERLLRERSRLQFVELA